MKSINLFKRLLVGGFILLAALTPGCAQEKSSSGSGTQELLPSMGRVELPGGQASLNLSGGYSWLNPDQTKELFVTKWGNSNFTSELGAILPPGFSPDGEGVLWLALLRYHPSGHVSDVAKVDAASVLSGLKAMAEKRNQSRKSQNLPPVQLKGWAVEPKFDDKRHSLIWAVEWVIGNDSAYDFHVAFLGKGGWLDAQLMVSVAELALAKDSLDKLQDMVAFAPGQGWNDFKQGDSESHLSAGSLFWNLDADQEGFPLLIWGVLGLVFILAASAVVFLLVRRKK